MVSTPNKEERSVSEETTPGAFWETLGPVVPVATLDDPRDALPLAEALYSGGIGVAEITLRTPAGLASIASIASTADTSDFVVGAGTVLTIDQIDAAVQAGAQFVVTPGYDSELVSHAHRRGIEILPGVATATEVQRAWREGVSTVKLFPATRLGGLDTIRDLAGPFPGVRFIPSGGVGQAEAIVYLSHPSVPAVCGSWMIQPAALSSRDFSVIAELSRSTMTSLDTSRERAAEL